MQVENEEKNFFRDEETRRLRVERRNRSLIRMAIILVGLVFASVFLNISLRLGDVSFAAYIESVIYRLQGFYNILSGNSSADTAGVQFVFFRALVAILVGATLSSCGAIFQGSFRNALASPTTLGLEAGGMAAGLFFLLVFLHPDSFSVTSSYEQISLTYQGMSFWQKNLQSIFIAGGCLVTIALVVGIATAAGRGKLSSLTLILSGFIFTSLIASGTGLVQYYMITYYPSDPRIDSMRTLMMGTMNRITNFDQVLLIGIPVLVCLAIIFFMRSRFNILVFGEEEAKAMGMRVGLFRNFMLIICTVMTAVTISFCGQVAFVGLIVPHLARMIVGPDFRALIPASMLMGGIVMVAAHIVAVAIGYDVNLSVVTGAMGGLFFLVFLIVFRRKRHADWA